MSRWRNTLERLRAWLLLRVIELGGVLVIALASGVLLALLSYSPFDPSWNVSSNSEPRNWLGLAGAYTSDLILQSFGWAFVAFLPAALAFGARRLRHTTIDRRAWRSIAVVIAPIALAAAVALWPYGQPIDGALAGGFIGQTLAELIMLGISYLPVESAGAIADIVIALLLGLPAVALSLFAAGWLQRFTTVLGQAPRAAMRALARLWSMRPRRREDVVTDADETAFDAGEADVDAPLDDEDDRDFDDTPSPRGRVAVAEKITQLKPGNRTSREAQPSLRFDADQNFKLPPLNLLTQHRVRNTHQLDKSGLEANAHMLENVLAEFGVKGTISNVRPGPVVTLYEFEPAAGVRSSRVVGLADDIARSMSAIACRVAPVPGANAIGIELPNHTRELVSLRELLASADFEKSKSRLTIALGKDIGGAPALADLAKMPHLLVAGTTGSGKSVGINTMILSILYRMTPQDCRLILVDPKMLELSVYDGIPHLLAPVVTEPKKAVVALKWVVKEMENRYRKMSKIGVRNIEGYNERMREAIARKETLTRRVQTGFDHNTGEAIFEEQEIAPETLPFIVVVIDEMADLMMVAGKEIEGAVQRLAQMARAAGVHLITATQRPSVDVITGTIKANFPSRISFQVTSRIDSRTVLGEQGAEQLLGQGDMLFMGGAGRVQRIHGPFVSDEEVEKVVAFLKKQGVPEYIESVTEAPEEDAVTDGGGESGDSLYDQAVAIVTRDGRASTSYVQRRLQIGYNRAARLIEEMEEQGVISAPNHAGKREVLAGKH
jgi:S-DNA-T family DNA segregation ATPase FtsK/SpoIIIE